MNNRKSLYRKISKPFYKGYLFIISMLIGLSTYAQIPQNIEVEGEPEQGWQYLLYIVALLIVIAVIFLVLRIAKKSKKSD